MIEDFAVKISIHRHNLQIDGTTACRAQTLAADKRSVLDRQPEKVLPLFIGKLCHE